MTRVLPPLPARCRTSSRGNHNGYGQDGEAVKRFGQLMMLYKYLTSSVLQKHQLMLELMPTSKLGLNYGSESACSSNVDHREDSGAWLPS